MFKTHAALMATSFFMSASLACAGELTAADQDIINGYVDAQAPVITKNALAIWNLAEPGFREMESAKLLMTNLKSQGFKIEAGVAGMPSAFVASYKTGPGPVIAILAEFDALPGISQQADKTTPQPVAGRGAGHACGHNLIGAGAAGGAIAVRQWMESRGIKGEVRLYGTPAEEGGDGKSYMVRDGLFKDVDIVIHWHPMDGNGVWNTPSQANIKTDFTFHGVSSHAAAAPEWGRSALAGLEVMDVAVNYMRQFTPDGTRIHGIVVEGGKAPNVIPSFAKSSYYVRHVDVKILQDLQARVLKTAQGAAMATETKVDWEIQGGVYPLLINKTLNKVAYKNLQATIGKLSWTESEVAYAKGIQDTLGTTRKGQDFTALEPLEPKGGMGGSTDVGDISYTVPTVGLALGAWPKGTPAHSWASTAASGSSIGTKAAVLAARTIAITAVELMQSPDLIAQAKAEFRASLAPDFKYEALFGNRAPPLDYTDKLMGKGTK